MGQNLGQALTQFLTQNTVGADSTKRHGAGRACFVPLAFFGYIALLMTSPMVSAASRFISFVAWV